MNQIRRIECHIRTKEGEQGDVQEFRWTGMNRDVYETSMKSELISYHVYMCVRQSSGRSLSVSIFLFACLYLNIFAPNIPGSIIKFRI